MSLFTVLVNGAPRTTGQTQFADGSTSVPSLSFGSAPTLGWYRYNPTNIGLAAGGNPASAYGASGIYLNSNGAFNFASGLDAGSGIDTKLTRDAAGKLRITDNGSTLAILLVGTLGDSSNAMTIASTRCSFSIAGALDFPGAASTFASVATLTNGPRAANPVNWVKVKYNGGASSGRMPIW